MTPRDQKLAFLRQLSQESEPITLSAILDKIQLDYSDRTVRRWLQELVKEGLVQKSGQTKDAKYIAVKLAKETSNQVSSCFGSKSLRAIKQIKRQIFEREPVAYNDQWFDSYQPNTSFYLSEAIRSKLKSEGQRANKHDPAGTYAHQIFNRLLIDLSYNSARLEGCTYSLLDTERLLIHGDTPEGKLDEEKVMILNHKEAIRFLVEKAPGLAVSQETLFTLHYLLSDGLVESHYAGKVRDHSVRIGGSTYVPFEDPKRLKMQIKKISEKAAAIEDPFEQSFFLLVHVSYIQAFTDVNKRTARLSANIPLIVRNYVPLSFNDVGVDDYMAAMISIYELQDVHPLIDLYVYSYMRTCAAYDATVKAMGFDEVRVRYRQQRREVLREVILQKLTGNRLKKFVEKEAQKVVLLEHRSNFVEDVWEDLKQIDESRIVGLGVTVGQLKKWLSLRSKL
jgi:Fic family protein